MLNMTFSMVYFHERWLWTLKVTKNLSNIGVPELLFFLQSSAPK